MKGEDPEMEVEEAQYFDYRGEGAANIVLTYRGSNPFYVGKVLRIRKKNRVHGEHHNAAHHKPMPTSPQPQPATASVNRAQVSSGSAAESHHPRSLPLADSTPPGMPEAAPHPHPKHPPEPVLGPEERELWKDWPDVAGSLSSADLVHTFTKEIMRPLLGEEHVDPGIPVHVSRPFLEILERQIEGKRPKWRIEKGHLELARGRAMIISDHSLFPPSPETDAFEAPTICVEIKPKAGFLPTAPTIAPTNEVKRRVSRFQLHQHLKLARREVSSLSKYNPLDFFSGQPEKVRSAISSLFETPQNNVRVFREGVEIFGVTRAELEEELGRGLGGGSSLHFAEQTGTGSVEGNGPSGGSAMEKKQQQLEQALEGFFDLPIGQRAKNLQNLLADALLQTEILSRLLLVHRLDSHDIEGTIHAFNRFMQSLTSAGKSSNQSEAGSGNAIPERAKGLALTNAELADAAADTASVHRVPDAELAHSAEVARQGAIERIRTASVKECKKIVQNFLIAATAKDCGLMATFRPIRGRHSAEPADLPLPGPQLVLCKTTGQLYMFKLSFVDLDVKPLKKVPDYLALDQAIVAHYNDRKASKA